MALIEGAPKLRVFEPMTVHQLLAVMPTAKNRLTEEVVKNLNLVCEKYQIATPARKAAFIAQIAHESGELRYVKELASGAAYDTRTDLGNTPELDGDGQKYKGRGYIQCTGRHNYTLAGFELELDLVNKPEILELPYYAALISGWFWNKERLNQLADAGEFRKITKEVNGGYNHLEERTRYWLKGLPVFAGIRLNG